MTTCTFGMGVFGGSSTPGGAVVRSVPGGQLEFDALGLPAVVQRFEREAQAAGQLRHPNIVKIYAVGRDGDAVYFAMDFLPSGLADKLESVPFLPEEFVVRVGIDVARALGFAHREGVVHRDIKVDNILFDSHGNAVVADFGIARAVSDYTNQTGTNMVVGTPQYFAPEQARAKPLDGRADIYSLGVVLYQLLAGRLPFVGDDGRPIVVSEPRHPIAEAYRGLAMTVRDKLAVAQGQVGRRFPRIVYA